MASRRRSFALRASTFLVILAGRAWIAAFQKAASAGVTLALPVWNVNEKENGRRKSLLHLKSVRTAAERRAVMEFHCGW